MDPSTMALLIPILALCIPIAAIVTAGRNKRAQIAAQNRGNVDVTRLEARVAELELQLSSVHVNVLQIEEKQDFISRLLEDKSE